MNDDAMEIATAMVFRWEHGSDEHRQWLRDMCVPEIASAIEAAEARMRERAACEIESTPGMFRSEHMAARVRALPDRETEKCTAYPINGCAHPQFCQQGCAGVPRK